jgi:hypothetical protein
MGESGASHPSGTHRAKQLLCCALLSLLAFLTGLVILFLTFWFTYAVIWFGMLGISAASELLFDKRLALTHVWRLLLSSVFIVLLFVGNARTSREYLSNYPKRNYPGPALAASGLAGSLLCLLGYPQTSAKMICDLLYTGPRLVVYACRNAVGSFASIKMSR